MRRHSGKPVAAAPVIGSSRKLQLEHRRPITAAARAPRLAAASALAAPQLAAGAMATRAAVRALFLAIACVSVARAAVVVSLDGRGNGSPAWHLRNGNGSVEISGCTVPSFPLELLRAHGIISDPNYRFGELESRWVAEDTWTYTLSFDSSSLPQLDGVLAAKEAVLQLGGVDTFATVQLNGHQILAPNNFHRSWAVPVRRWLAPAGQRNTLSITLRPAAAETLRLKSQHPYSVPSLAQMGSVGSYIWARKPASDFGWDWGPAFAPAGIHGSIRLLGYDFATLSSAHVAQHQETSASGEAVFRVNVTSQLLVPAGGDEGELVVEIPGLNIVSRQALLPDAAGYSSPAGDVAVTAAAGGMRYATIVTQLTVPAADAELWWPVGYGGQRLYDVNIAFVPKSVAAACADAAGTPAALEACSAASQAGLSALTRRMGFRSVELVRLPAAAAVRDLFPAPHKGWGTNASFYQQKDSGDGHWAQTTNGTWQHFGRTADQSDIDGESFYFKVNGVPIFMKGANLIPSHIIHTNVTADMLTDTLKYALDSNMNMIRVWGGGRYPVEHLFSYADEHGLLIWMETMFACSPYPRDPAFLDNVAAEVAQQAQRLSWHPSVAIWGGNNEIEGSLNWYAESRSNRALFANDYQALFVDTVRRVLRQVNAHMPFVDSSPSNGVIADNEREYVKRWGDDWDWRYGDVHWYAYESDCEDWTTYPKSKFISEFGSQSYPTFATYAEATNASDWQVDNPMTGFRNRRFGNGLEVFEAQFKRHFRLPSSWSAPNDPAEALKLFKSFIYITHMQQARCYESAINYWRRLRASPSGLTMGVLYWQLNDNSAFASWSGYDYGGRWKPLAYSVKRMYAPLQVQAITNPTSDAVQVYLVNDFTTPVTASVTVRLLSMEHSEATCSAAGAAGAAAGAAAAAGSGLERGAAAAKGKGSRAPAPAAAAPAKAATAAAPTPAAAAAAAAVPTPAAAAPRAAAAATAAAATAAAELAPVAAFDFTVPPGFASEAWSLPITQLLASRPACARDSCYVSVTAVVKRGVAGAAGAAAPEVSEAQLWLVPLKDITFPDPGLRLSGFGQQTVVAAAASASAAAAAAGDISDADAAAIAAATNSYEADAPSSSGSGIVASIAAATGAAHPYRAADAADEAHLQPLASAAAAAAAPAAAAAAVSADGSDGSLDGSDGSAAQPTSYVIEHGSRSRAHAPKAPAAKAASKAASKVSTAAVRSAARGPSLTAIKAKLKLLKQGKARAAAAATARAASTPTPPAVAVAAAPALGAARAAAAPAQPRATPAPAPARAAPAAAAAAPITFTLSAARPAALTTLVTKYRGRFSDDALTALHPCSPRTIMFYPHASAGPLTAGALAADLRAESLFDHQYAASSSASTAGASSGQPGARASPVPAKATPAGAWFEQKHKGKVQQQQEQQQQQLKADRVQDKQQRKEEKEEQKADKAAQKQQASKPAAAWAALNAAAPAAPAAAPAAGGRTAKQPPAAVHRARKQQAGAVLVAAQV